MWTRSKDVHPTMPGPMNSLSKLKIGAALALSILGRAEALGAEIPVPRTLLQSDVAVLQSSRGDRTRTTMRPFILKLDEALPTTQTLAAC